MQHQDCAAPCSAGESIARGTPALHQHSCLSFIPEAAAGDSPSCGAGAARVGMDIAWECGITRSSRVHDSRVVDTDNTSFTLFVRSRYTMSRGDVMDYEVAQNSEDVNRTILGPMECYNPLMMMAGFPHGGTL